jgi:hypothetical protein
MEEIDELEARLQNYLDDFSKLAEGLSHGTGGDSEAMAIELGTKKREMIALVQGMAELDKGEEELLRELKAWESLNKQSIVRAQKAESALQKAENAVKEALEDLQKD